MYDLTKEKGISIYEEVVFRTTADDAAKSSSPASGATKGAFWWEWIAKALDLLTRFFPGDRCNLEQCVQQADCPKYANK